MSAENSGNRAKSRSNTSELIQNSIMIIAFLSVLAMGCIEYTDNAAEERYISEMQQMCILQYMTVSEAEKDSLLFSCLFYFLPEDVEGNE